MVRVAPQEAGLLRGQGRPQRGHGVLDSRGSQGHHVHVALRDQGGLLLPDRVPTPAEGVEHRAFVVDRRLRGIQVLRNVLPGRPQNAAPEAHHPPHLGLDGKDDAIPEPIVGLAGALRRRQKPHLEEQFVGDAVKSGGRPKPPPVIRRIPEPEALLGRFVDAPLGQVGPGLRTQVGVRQGPAEEIPGEGVGLVMRAEGVVLGLSLPDFADLHPVAGAQVADGVEEAEALTLHEEPEHVPLGSASEAVIHPLVGDHEEGRGPVLVERTLPLVVLPGALEGDHLSHDLDDVGPLPDLLHHLVGNHWSTATVTPAPPSPYTPPRNSRTRRSRRSSSCTRAFTAPVPFP